MAWHAARSSMANTKEKETGKEREREREREREISKINPLFTIVINIR